MAPPAIKALPSLPAKHSLLIPNSSASQPSVQSPVRSHNHGQPPQATLTTSLTSISRQRPLQITSVDILCLNGNDPHLFFGAGSTVLPPKATTLSPIYGCFVEGGRVPRAPYLVCPTITIHCSRWTGWMGKVWNQAAIVRRNLEDVGENVASDCFFLHKVVSACTCINQTCTTINS